jgi:hypothetical protein
MSGGHPQYLKKVVLITMFLMIIRVIFGSYPSAFWLHNQKCFGTTPDYSELRVFGCAFVLLPKRERTKLFPGGQNFSTIG